MIYIILFPIVTSIIFILFGKFLNKKIISFLAPASIFLSFLFSLKLFLTKSFITKTYFEWINVGSLKITFSLTYDHLSSVMVLMVSFVSFLIHIYSIGYMHEDESYSRFFAYLNLFTFFMFLLVLSSNIVLMFVGWEGVGLCSYLLIGFWFERDSASKAGMKAFVVNRIGDFGFIIGILLIITLLGTVNFKEINSLLLSGKLSPFFATLIGLLLFTGATGKSAQIPLYVWLPDAMEGPTPVSALIHAATMVTAGVYMIVRLNGIYHLSPVASEVVAVVGILTALFSATIAITQNDIKRVLAYSTISQIGYMVFAAGIGAYTSSMFHLTTHAFFKALLFLGAGSVIHSMGGVQDIQKMGNLKKYMPITFITFLIAGLSISGFPGFSGFFSKDEILEKAFFSGHKILWGVGVFTAFLTAFYIFRLIFLTFYGNERFREHERSHLHESPKVMTIPLMVLAFFSVVAGYLSLPSFISKHSLWNEFLKTSVVFKKHIHHPDEKSLLLLTLFSVVVGILGIILAYIFYVKREDIPEKICHKFSCIYTLLKNKYYVDEVYEELIVNPVIYGGEGIHDWFDSGVIDGFINKTSKGFKKFSSTILSSIQNGLLRRYYLLLLLGIAVIISIVFVG